MTPDREAVRSELNDGWKRLLLALADMDEEEGNPDRAAGLRWLVENNKVPRKDADAYKWYVTTAIRASQVECWDSLDESDPEDLPGEDDAAFGWRSSDGGLYETYLQGAEIVGRWLRSREEK